MLDLRQLWKSPTCRSVHLATVGCRWAQLLQVLVEDDAAKKELRRLMAMMLVVYEKSNSRPQQCLLIGLR
eukprot:COSAG02_NODE_786_length_17199_cov_25.278889_23_plen_70_part_00